MSTAKQRFVEPQNSAKMVNRFQEAVTVFLRLDEFKGLFITKQGNRNVAELVHNGSQRQSSWLCSYVFLIITPKNLFPAHRSIVQFSNY